MIMKLLEMAAFATRKKSSEHDEPDSAIRDHSESKSLIISSARSTDCFFT